MATFDITKYYRSADGVETYSPFWIVAVVRFENPLTYSRKRRQSWTWGMDEREPLVLSHECIQVSVTASKGSHISSLNVTIEPTREFVNEMMPGDWVFAWMLRDRFEGLRVLELVRQKKAANDFYDGLKFVGRVQSLRKTMRVNPHSGAKDITYMMMGAGFTELDNSVFYEPQLLKQQVVPAQLDELGVFLQNIVVQENKDIMDEGLIDINKMLPALSRVFLGPGAYDRTQGIEAPDGSIIEAAPTGAPLVPATAAAWLGAPQAKTYSDVMDIVSGIQAFSADDDITHSDRVWEHFLPFPLMEDPLFKKASPHSKTYFTGNPLRGQFSVLIPPIMNQPFWSVLGNFLNHPINEMTMALRANPEGRIVPMMTVRQIPFSSPYGIKEDDNYVTNDFSTGWKAPDFTPKDKLQKPDVTKFIDLPRWKISSVWQADIGRSDALRTNYVHISGVPGVGTAVDEVNMFVRCPPLRDDEDIGRSGLRPYQATVNCTFVDTVIGPSRWRDIMADILMGQHLTLTGSLQLPGVDLPIAPGDNVEFEEVVYHIETITHAAGIGPDGNKYFQTILQLSNGVAAKVDYSVEDTGHYAGVGEVEPHAHVTIEVDDE